MAASIISYCRAFHSGYRRGRAHSSLDQVDIKYRANGHLRTWRLKGEVIALAFCPSGSPQRFLLLRAPAGFPPAQLYRRLALLVRAFNLGNLVKGPRGRDWVLRSSGGEVERPFRSMLFHLDSSERDVEPLLSSSIRGRLLQLRAELQEAPFRRYD